MTILNFARDSVGLNTFTRTPVAQKFSGTLMNGVEQTVTVPLKYGKKCWALFYYSPGTVWVAVNKTATYPTGSFSEVDSAANPISYHLKGGDVIHFITNNTSVDVGIEFYELLQQ